MGIEAADAKLISPFLDEARKPWAWSQFYRAVAQSIHGKDPVKADNVQVGNAGGDDNADAEPCERVSSNYDIDAALALLRRGHAWEVQNFVVAHENACLEKIIEEIGPERQVKLLENRVTEWIVEHGNHCDSDEVKHLAHAAKIFAEVVHREEMSQAEGKIKMVKVSFGILTMILRITCVVSLMLAFAFMSHEALTKLFAILFAIGCGMALLWEDLVRSCVQVMLGETFKRLDSLCAQLLRLKAFMWDA